MLKLQLIKLNCALDKVNKGDNDLDELSGLPNEKSEAPECCPIRMPQVHIPEDL